MRTPLERQRECGNPLVVVAELILAGIGVVDAIDVLRLQRRIVLVRRAEVVMAAPRLVEVVVEVGAGRDQAVDVAVRDEVGDDQPQPAGAEGARHPEEDRAVAAEHLFPDAARDREIPPLKRNALHPRQEVAGRRVGQNDEGFHGRAKKTGLRLHAAVILPRKTAAEYADYAAHELIFFRVVRVLRGSKTDLLPCGPRTPRLKN